MQLAASGRLGLAPAPGDQDGSAGWKKTLRKKDNRAGTRRGSPSGTLSKALRKIHPSVSVSKMAAPAADLQCSRFRFPAPTVKWPFSSGSVQLRTSSPLPAISLPLISWPLIGFMASRLFAQDASAHRRCPAPARRHGRLLAPKGAGGQVSSPPSPPRSLGDDTRRTQEARRRPEAER